MGQLVAGLVIRGEDWHPGTQQHSLAQRTWFSLGPSGPFRWHLWSTKSNRRTQHARCPAGLRRSEALVGRSTSGTRLHPTAVFQPLGLGRVFWLSWPKLRVR